MAYILATKLGMTRVFTDDGRAIGVTVLEAGPCTVTQVKTTETDGYQGVQVGFGIAKHLGKPGTGHQAKAKSTHKWLREFRVKTDELPAVGDIVTVEGFTPGMSVKLVGKGKGKGFAGTIERHNFKKGPETHGSDQHRQPGSIGSGFPQHVFAGMRMAGHMGARGVTVSGATVHAIHPSDNLLVVTGPVPGANKSLLFIESVGVIGRTVEPTEA